MARMMKETAGASSKALTVPAKAGRNVMSVDITKVDYATLAKRAEKFAGKVGAGGAGFKKTFPGEQISFNKGKWLLGYGDKGKQIKSPEFVMNLANAVCCWQTWKETENGKKYPHFTDLVFLASGDELPDRESLGDTDESEWDVVQGKPQDPWKPIIVIPVREADGDTINHVMLSAKSHVGAGYNFFREWAEEASMHLGELPVVELGSETVSRQITEKVKGKDVKSKQSWDIPTFEITSWVDVQACDNPGPNGIAVSDGADGDVGEVEAKERTSVKAGSVTEGYRGKNPAPMTKDGPKPASAKKARKVVEVEDGDDI